MQGNEYRLLALSLSDDDISTENLITRMFARTVDMFSRLFKNIINVTLRMFKGFTRSEIRYYKESNPLYTKKIQTLNYVDIAKCKIVFPEGLLVPYADAFVCINKILAQSDTVKLLDEATLLLNRLDTEGYTNKSMLNELTAWSTKNTIYDIKSIGKDMNKIFTTQRDKTDEKPFSELFKSMNDYNYVFNGLLDAERYYHRAKTTYEKTEQFNDLVNTVVTKLERDTSLITKEAALILYDFVHTIAVQIDIFGAVCTELQRVEHNFVLSTRLLEYYVK